MKHLLFAIPAIMIFPAFPAALPGTGLEWARTHAEVPAQPLQESVKVAFPFENKGNDTVEILSIHTDCGCTGAELKERVIAPGERGAIEVEFKFEERTGHQRKVTTVTTDAGPEPVLLVLETRIPEAFAVRPQLTQWQPGEIPDRREIEVEWRHELEIKHLKIKSRETWLATEVETLEPGRRFRISLIPEEIEGQTAVALGVEATFEDGRTATLPAFILVHGD